MFFCIASGGACGKSAKPVDFILHSFAREIPKQHLSSIFKSLSVYAILCQLSKVLFSVHDLAVALAYISLKQTGKKQWSF